METEILPFEMVLKPHQLKTPKIVVLESLEKKVGTCSREHGILIQLVSLKRIENRKISNITGNCMICAHAEFKLLKPKTGHKYRAMIKAMFKEGIFLDYYGARILVPSNFLEGWVFTNDTFKRVGNKKEVLASGDWIDVVITLVQYENKMYQCVGKMK